MDFLAIDLEACNMYVKGSVFSIGMVCSDEHFNIKYKRNILINPKCKFAMHFRKPIEFHIDMSELQNYPPIEDFYDELKTLFSGDVLVIAHSANNDMYMLNNAFRRAGLPPLKFEYICSQLIYSAVFDYPNGIGLDKVSEDLHIGFTHHLADDDAEMCLYLLKYCMEKLNCSEYSELEKKLKITRGHIDNYQLYPMHSGVLESLRSQHRREKAKLKKRLLKEADTSDAITMTIDSNFFDMIKYGGKKVEVRVNDEKRRLIKVGDVLYFNKRSARPDVLKVRVTSLTYKDSFLELYSCYNPAELGFKDVDLLGFLSSMANYYPPEREKTYGVVGIGVEVIED